MLGHGIPSLSVIAEILKCFVLERHEADLQSILRQEDDEEHYPIQINALTLFESCTTTCYTLCTSPLVLLPIFDAAIVEAEAVVHQQLTDNSQLSVKPYIHARITSLPVQLEFTRATVPKTSDFGNFLALIGTVIRTSVAKVLEYEKDFICAKCKTTISVKADLVQFNSLGKPTKCTNDVCNSTNFTLVAEKGGQPVKCRNYQEIKIQEQVQRLAMGTIPRSIWVVLEDDLVDTCKAGDDVVICGTVLRRWRNLSADTKCDIELFLKANSVIVTNEQRNSIAVTQELREDIAKYWNEHKYTPLTGRNHILSCLCPQVYGLYVVKLAVAMVLAGGVQRQDESGTFVRGEIHMLLVGDPGTGKSQFLKYASKITPRSVLTTGIGSTSAGLTVTAVKDGGEWQLEAGALVLADGGLCCIDEFNSIKEHDKASIHEAMEQQTISVAKAGMVCKLSTRTTILAATNPKGHYDPNESLSVNIALASPLLSRFDLVLVLLDTQNQDWDRIVSTYILQGNHPLELEDKDQMTWSMDKMQGYISLIKTINPELTPDATKVLRNYYHAQRSSDDRNAARTTMRLLQSMIRLSQAHARLMFRDRVLVQDAVVAVTLMESSMQGAALLGGVNALHTAFPEDPEEEYKIQAQLILQRLGLSDLLEDEMKSLQDLINNRKDNVVVPICKDGSTYSNHASLDAVLSNTYVDTSDKILRKGGTDFEYTENKRLTELETYLPCNQDTKNMLEREATQTKSYKVADAAETCHAVQKQTNSEHEALHRVQKQTNSEQISLHSVQKQTNSEQETLHIGQKHRNNEPESQQPREIQSCQENEVDMYKSLKAGFDVSNISLTDLLNSSNEELSNDIVAEFPTVGFNCDTSTPTSSCGSVDIKNNYTSKLRDELTPFTKVLQHARANKCVKTVDIQDVGIENTKATGNVMGIAGVQAKSVIRQTIETRLTQMPKMVTPEEKHEAFVTERDGVSCASDEKRLICVKAPKSRLLGECSVKLSAKMKKALKKVTELSAKKLQKVQANDIDCEKCVTNTKQRSMKQICISDLDSDFEMDNCVTDAKQKSVKRAFISDSDTGTCEEVRLINSERFGRVGMDNSLADESSLNEENYLKVKDIAPAETKVLKVVSKSTLSKLKKFKFDDGYIESQSGQCKGSRNSSNMSGKLWINDSVIESSIENFSKNSEVVTSKVGDSGKNNTEENTRSAMELNEENKMHKSTDGAKHIEGMSDMTKIIDRFNKGNVTSEQQKSLSDRSSSHLLGDKNIDLSGKSNSPSWLVTLKKKFSSPCVQDTVLSSNSCGVDPPVIGDDDVDCMLQDDNDFGSVDFLLKLKGAQKHTI